MRAACLPWICYDIDEKHVASYLNCKMSPYMRTVAEYPTETRTFLNDVTKSEGRAACAVLDCRPAGLIFGGRPGTVNPDVRSEKIWCQSRGPEIMEGR